ncbi:DNA-binding transcriptional regulator, LysR family [Lachnospiraceae bacterium NK3A20]|nr:DNA-binding transcriptional regulator, LysR family [Lachnospiraceae bacterium NK3A20]
MTLQQLQQVIMIADCGSMNEAAKRLYVSQPNLSAVVKELEKEIGLTIFLRSNRGIRITPEGEQFIGYARQVVEQYSLLENKYIGRESKKIFSVSAQHYSFAVKAFVETVKRVGMDQYEFAMHETKTHTVIDNVRNMISELGVLYLSDFNEKVLHKIFRENNLIFTELFACDTYVYLWKNHPLAGRRSVSMDDLKDYPCLAFEQGSANSFYYAEEMKSTYEYGRIIKADDRATMLNLMVGLNGYTLCSGIISEELNGEDYIAVPLKKSENEKMHIGFLKHKDVKLSDLGNIYIEELVRLPDPDMVSFTAEIRQRYGV